MVVQPITDRPIVEATRQILHDLQFLTEDEMISAARLVRKMREGSKKHGHLNLEADRRNMLEEAQAEVDDCFHYLNFFGLKLERLIAKMKQQGLDP